jgi:class 3 adenylate cyclase
VIGARRFFTGTCAFACLADTTLPMPKLPIFRFRPPDRPSCPKLQLYRPALSLTGLQLGVDNLRYDVHLGSRVTQDLGLHIARYIRLFGEVESLFEMDVPVAPKASYLRTASETNSPQRKLAASDLKNLLVSLHLAILNRAKVEENPSVDLLGRLAVIKFIRSAMQAQFSHILEQCRMKSKSLEGLRQAKMFETQTLVATFQISRKIILRKTSQELFQLLREIEKETLARTRRSLFGEIDPETYRLFQNPLIFTDNGRDDYLCAERYYMFGNFERDPDRFYSLRGLALRFLEQQGCGSGEDLDQALNVPENALVLVGAGNSEESSPEDFDCQHRLKSWTSLLQDENVLRHVIASYEAVPLLTEYAPRINPQQVKHALLSREECERVRTIIAECRMSSEPLMAGVARVVASCRSSERKRIAARLLRDLLLYHRDLRGLEAVNAGLDSVNLIGDERVLELSTINGMLYEFLPPEDQREQEARVLGHVILKADVRDSSRLTRSLMEKGMNAASYFSLNFYEPVNKLLAKYGAQKVFLEGDAIILALLEREGEAILGVSRACVLAWEMLALIRNCNELLERSGLPPLEVGLGISYQDSAPLYLMDGDRRIMISDAINAADRLSSCNKRLRKKLASDTSAFQVYTFQVGDGKNAQADFEEFTINYNVGGICLSDSAFRKLQQEISLSRWSAGFRGKWLDPKREFYLGTVPLTSGAFRKIVIRKSRVGQVDVRDLSFLRWTERDYFEVCANPAVYEALPDEKSSAASL